MKRRFHPDLVELVRSLLIPEGDGHRLAPGAGPILEEALAVFETDRETVDALLGELHVRPALSPSERRNRAFDRRPRRAPMVAEHRPSGTFRVGAVFQPSVFRP